ncbi:hypothetical protein NKH77_33535 [Streptomyces sp. M19]
MSVRHTSNARRAAAAALAAVLALAVAGCGSGGDDDPGGGSPQSAGRSADSGDKSAKNQPAVDTGKTIGQVKGPGGIEVTLHAAVRDGGGFVTVSGTLTNDGDQLFNAVDWRSKETEVKSRSSISARPWSTRRARSAISCSATPTGSACAPRVCPASAGESRPVSRSSRPRRRA